MDVDQEAGPGIDAGGADGAAAALPEDRPRVDARAGGADGADAALPEDRPRVDERARQAAMRAIDVLADVEGPVEEVPVEQLAAVAAEFNAAALACARRARSFGGGQAARVLAESAAQAAIRQVESEGQQIAGNKLDVALAAALTVTSGDYESMLEKAVHSVREEALVVTVLECSGRGPEMELSLSTLGGTSFEVSFQRGARVLEIA